MPECTEVVDESAPMGEPTLGMGTRCCSRVTLLSEVRVASPWGAREEQGRGQCWWVRVDGPRCAHCRTAPAGEGDAKAWQSVAPLSITFSTCA